MSALVALDGALRFVALGALMVLATALILDRRGGVPGWLGLALVLAGACHTLDRALVFAGETGPRLFPTWFFSAAGAGVYWLFCVTLFADHGRFRLWRLWGPGALAASALLGLVAPAPLSPAVWIFHKLFSVGLVLWALVVLARRWPDELEAPQRRVRMLVIAVGAYIALINLSRLTHFGAAPTSVLEAAALALLAVIGAAVALRVDVSLFAQPHVARRAADGAVSAADTALLARLQAVMDDEEAWRREDITIGGLAARVGAREHQLRRLINGRLGHRNFAAFINARRIAAAVRELHAEGSSHKSISTIAYGLGFGSLGPFQRAFKQATGFTPSDWRSSARSPQGHEVRADFEKGAPISRATRRRASSQAT